VLPLTASAGTPLVSYPLVISLAGLIPPIPDPINIGKFLPSPLPYSVGVDSDTNNAVVAYSSSSNPTSAKVGFLLDLNKDSQTCLAGAAQTTAPCVHAQVTLNTGTYPQVAMVPHSHLALVTPGGIGSINGIDVTKSSSQLPIKNISVTSGLVTVSVDLPSGQTLGLNPGNPGTVLIQGIPTTALGTTFDGAFTVQSVLSTNTFSYALNNKGNDSATCTTDASDPTNLSKNPCQVYFSSPNIVIGISQTAQGIAINPITRTAAIADANATGSNGPQIDLLNSLDQSVTSIIFQAGCTFYTSTTTNPCSNAPELLGTSSVAFQPYANSLVSYNPQQNQLSVSNPVAQQRFTITCVVTGSSCPTPPAVPADQTSTIAVTVNGATTTLTLFGGLSVDPATNQAFVVQSASGTIQIVNLGSLKAVHISELQVPTVSGAEIGGIAGAVMPQGTLTSASPALRFSAPAS
jgi:hypothetical protein